MNPKIFFLLATIAVVAFASNLQSENIASKIPLLKENSHRVSRFAALSGIGDDLSAKQWQCLARSTIRNGKVFFLNKKKPDSLLIMI